MFQAYYKKLFLHFNNSFDLKFIRKKIKENYPKKYKDFSYLKKKLKLEKFDKLNFKKEICFVKIDVEGFDHLFQGMAKLINLILLFNYNLSNFEKIFNFLKKIWLFFFMILKKKVSINFQLRKSINWRAK